MLMQSMRPEGDNWSLDYTKSLPIKESMTSSPRGFVPGEQMHHTAIVDVYEPIYRNTNPQEAAILNDYAESLGVPMGNHPKNFVSMSEFDHLSGMHGYARDIKMQLNNLGADERLEIDQFLNKIGNSSLQAKKEALKLMIEFGQPIMDDRLKSLGYDFKDRTQLAKEYDQDTKIERALINKEHNVEALRRLIEGKKPLTESGKPLRGRSLVEARIDDLLAIKDPVRKAGDELVGMIRINSAGDTIDSPVTNIQFAS